MMKLQCYLFCGLITCLVSIPSAGNTMWHKKTTTITEEWGSEPASTARRALSQCPAEDLIKNNWRIQLFSIQKSQGKSMAHNQLEEMRKKAPHIANYTALIVSEAGSNWLRGQIGPFTNKTTAESMQASLKQIFTKDLPTVSAPGIVHQPGFKLESAEYHTWQ